MRWPTTVALCAFSSCCCPSSKSASAPATDPQSTGALASAADPIQTGPMAIWDAYEKNEVGADNLYRGKRLKFAAVIQAISKDALNTIVVDLAVRSGGRGSISCRFGDEWAQQIGALERGELVELECTGRGLGLGIPQLGDCAVKWVQPKDSEAFARVLAASEELCVWAKIGPDLLLKVDSGQLHDGGRLPAGWKQFALSASAHADENRDYLRKIKKLPLDCDQAAVTTLTRCDLLGAEVADSAQCSSDLIKKAWKYMHK